MDSRTVVDLRQTDPTHLAGALLRCLRDLQPGSSIRFRVREDPEWALRSVDLHLQHRLDWRCERIADGSWRVTVQFAEAAAADDLIGLLLRDHRRLDALVGHALATLNQGAAAGAVVAFAACANALRTHLRLEDQLLAPALQPIVPASAGAASDMQAEHAEVLQLLAAVEQSFAENPGDVSEAAILCALLAGLMAKHEHREESALFPFWHRALLHWSVAERTALTANVRQQLAG